MGIKMETLANNGLSKYFALLISTKLKMSLGRKYNTTIYQIA